MRFPVHTVHRRVFEDGFEGEVLTCDVDRTYLDTRFSSLKGIARVAFEGALDKVTIAGMAQLLKEVRRGPGEVSRHTPIYFVSGSPAQLRGVIERKLLLDGVEFDGTSFKDWTGLLKHGRFSGLKRQLAFKLAALLGNRSLLPPGAREILVGDDLEVDPLVYALYADILAGRLPPAHLPAVLQRHGVSAGEAEGLLGLKLRAGNQPGGVRRALIRLERS
ncbi:MAG: phosphatase domain-containing protein, partial [Pseudomonadota bacterium]